MDKSRLIIALVVLALVGATATVATSAPPSDFCARHPDHWRCQPPPPPPPPGPITTDCSTDSTAGLQALINAQPNGTVLTFQQGACYRAEGTLTVDGRTGLVLDGNGATFRASNPGGGHRPQFRFQGGTGNQLRNATLEGGYTNPGVHDTGLQWSHGVELLGAADTTITNLTVRNVAGDCVYDGLGTSRSSGTRVLGVTCDGTGRNGVSAVASNGLLVDGGNYSNVGYVVFDAEPNSGAGFGVDGATFRGATVGAYANTVGTIVGDNPVDNVTFANLTITAAKGARFQIGTQPPRRRTNITYTGNTATFASPLGYAIQAIGVDRLTVTGNVLPSGGVLLTCGGVTQVAFSGNTPNTSSGC